MANLVSFVILCFLLLGRRISNRAVHSAWMTSVIFADMALILVLVFARDALTKVSPAMSMALYIHLVFAVGTVILYILALWFGTQILLGNPHPGAMRGLDRLIVPCRTLTFITSVLLQLLATR